MAKPTQPPPLIIVWIGPQDVGMTAPRRAFALWRSYSLVHSHPETRIGGRKDKFRTQISSSSSEQYVRAGPLLGIYIQMTAQMSEYHWLSSFMTPDHIAQAPDLYFSYVLHSQRKEEG